MAAQLLDGKAMSGVLREEIAQRVTSLKEKGIHPGLAVILVGRIPPVRFTCATRASAASRWASTP